MTNCVSFQRSLELLILDNKDGAYGLETSGSCDVHWKAYQREGWLDCLKSAEAELKRDLGAPMCPQEICHELHPISKTIKLNQAPIAYIGVKTYSSWVEEGLLPSPVTSASSGYFDICDSEIPSGLTIDDIEVSYPDSILECYRGCQELQEPCVVRIDDGSCGGVENGYRLSWVVAQLIDPTEDSAQISETSKFLSDIKYRFGSVDTSLAVEYVGKCDCTQPAITATIADAIEGIICLDCGSSGFSETCPLCHSYYDYVRVSYATAFDCQTKTDPALEKAIVYLALICAGDTPAKPCGCDNTMIDRLLEVSPVAGTDFATKFTYGPTNAGLRVQQVINKYKEKPNFNESVTSGGMMLPKQSKNQRRSSYMRGY